jgi:hypothetical protein
VLHEEGLARVAAADRADAFLFLGDMERSAPVDGAFVRALMALPDSVRFCPVFGNHEALGLGPSLQEDFAEKFLLTPGTLRGFRPRCLTGVEGVAPLDRVYYSVDLGAGASRMHFVALDNVSDAGFGDRQIAWLERDLAEHRDAGAPIVVGMHKALALNGVTTHSMDEDATREDDRADRDSRWVVELLQEARVSLVVASHEHGFWEYQQGGLHSIISGGLGAPLKGCAGPAHAFHHFLVLDVRDGSLDVSVVREDAGERPRRRGCR